MRTIIIVIVFLSFATTAYGGPTSRVVGGIEATDGKYPHQVLLKIYGQLFCSGSILNSHYILTAGHCLIGQTIHGMTVTVGTNLNQYDAGDIYEVEKLIIHEDFNRFLFVNDIALIRLKKAIVFSDKVQTVQLSTKNFNSSEVIVRLSGWGQTGKLRPTSNVLMEIELNVISNERCKESWYMVKCSHLCTLTKAGEGACNRDSGGPLTFKNGIQVGIVSFGEGCAKGIPDVYTRIYSFIDWIQDNSGLLIH